MIHHAAIVVLLLGFARDARATHDLSGLIQEYRVDHDDTWRFFDLPYDEATYARRERFLDEWDARLAAVSEAELDVHGRVDAALLFGELRAERRALALDRARLAEMDELLPFRRAILELEHARRALDVSHPEQAATRIAPLAKEVDALRETIAGRAKAGKDEDPPPSAVVAQRAANATQRLRRVLEDWFRFYDGYEPSFSWWVTKPEGALATALESYERMLREDVAGQKGKDDDLLVGDPIGREALRGDLETEVLAYGPEELIAIGEREFAWCEARMKEASAAMGLGDDWKAALEQVKEDHVPPGEQDDLVAEQARFAIQFVTERDLVTVPPLCEELWRLSMLSPEGQKTLPFAAYSGQRMEVAYPTESMSHEDKLMSMRGNNRHFTRIVTPHELIPGHHLQGFQAARQRAYRRLFSTPFLVEGWALHWERLLWETGYPRTPQERIGMLFWRMHRAARVIVSLKFHLGQMQPGEMIDFLVERVGHERFGATSEVRRFIGGDYSPLYQCGYLIGGLQIDALRREFVDGKTMTDRAFHDAILQLGPIPIERMRETLRDAPPRRDQPAAWRF